MLLASPGKSKEKGLEEFSLFEQVSLVGQLPSPESAG